MVSPLPCESGAKTVIGREFLKFRLLLCQTIPCLRTNTSLSLTFYITIPTTDIMHPTDAPKVQSRGVLTTSSGSPVDNNQTSQTAGEDGPV